MSVNSFSGQPAIPASYGFTAGKNKIINGDFGVWQRGSSFTLTNESYTSDRFKTQTDKTGTISRETFTPATAPVAGYEGQYYLRSALNAVGSYFILNQPIEDVRTFAGQTITLSFWAKVSSGTAANAPEIIQNFGSGGSASVTTTLTGQTITTSWQRFSASVAIPSISGKTIGTSSSLEIRVLRFVSASAATIDIWGVQLEAGATATSFQTATGTIQGELAACQRYYFRYTGNSASQNPVGTGFALSSTQAESVIPYPTTMRSTPSLSYSAAADITFTWSAGTSSTSSVNPDLGSPQFLLLRINTSGLTTGTGGYYRIETGTTKYIELSAEL